MRLRVSRMELAASPWVMEQLFRPAAAHGIDFDRVDEGAWVFKIHRGVFKAELRVRPLRGPRGDLILEMSEIRWGFLPLPASLLMPAMPALIEILRKRTGGRGIYLEEGTSVKIRPDEVMSEIGIELPPVVEVDLTASKGLVLKW